MDCQSCGSASYSTHKLVATGAIHEANAFTRKGSSALMVYKDNSLFYPSWDTLEPVMAKLRSLQE
jgi:hypothetical protein